MNKPLLIIVTGLPASGKTNIGKYLAEQLGLPFIYKDGIKETLFDSLGWSDRTWSHKLGSATYDVLYYFLEATMKARMSLVIESNFHPETATPQLSSLIDKNGYEAVQVLCKADGEVLTKRYVERSKSGKRHPGHVDETSYSEMEPVLRKGRIDPVRIDAPLIEVDTTDFDLVNYEEILRVVQEAISIQERAKSPA